MKNGKHLCTVGSDDVWMFSARVWGELWGPEVSFLDVSGGGKHRNNGENDFLIWEMPHELVKGDCIAFFFEDGSESSPKGQLFDPSALETEQPKIDISVPPTDKDVVKLESRPSLNADLTWSFKINQGPYTLVAPDKVRQHVSLHVLWNEERPQRLRVNLSRSSLREIVGRTGGEELFLEYIPLGSSFEVAVVL
ncbi:hypothetical protein [Methylophilus methylotrophus]|uniref:hypothetical protein n=1 Tax=Methylophilus methylotrophus TaxID=17 RepID=UPI000F5A8569|nr:hypothetical protein [Methylophilus methylotrophus]